MAAKKRKAPATKKKRKKSAQHQADKKSSLFYFLFRWCFVLAIWGGIFTSGLVLWYAKDLPDITKTATFERRSAITFTDNTGTTIHRYGDLKGQAVSHEDIPDDLINAVISIEDRRFYEHGGIDVFGLGRAIVTNIIKGRHAQGGSTITQQLAKNMFLSHEKTYKRKIQEALLAFWIERHLTKDEIITAYLNRIYLGSGAYGVDAAAHIYFNKSASQLSTIESATIAGLLKAPSRYSPRNNPALSKARTDIVLAAMKDAGYLEFINQSEKNRPIRKPAYSGKSRHFTDWTLENMNALIGSDNLKSNDLTVATTLSIPIQRAAEKALYETIKTHGETLNITQGAIIVMRTDGAILAMVGGIGTDFNRATQAMRPPGSAFKPILYLSALENGWNITDTITDGPIKNASYSPKNFNEKYRGTVTLDEALTHSLNTASVRLLEQTGINNTIKTARKMGIKARLNKDLTMALGSNGIPLIEMTTAYAAIASGGKNITPYSILTISDNTTQPLYDHSPQDPGRILSRGAAQSIEDSLQNVVTKGTGQKAQLKNIRSAGKTGTSQDHRDALFIGYAGPFVTAVWLGNDDNSPMNGVTGGGQPAKIWKQTMTAALSNTDDHEKKAIHSDSLSDSFYNLIYSITGSGEPIATEQNNQYND